jgi:hypothetical protein
MHMQKENRKILLFIRHDERQITTTSAFWDSYTLVKTWIILLVNENRIIAMSFNCLKWEICIPFFPLQLKSALKKIKWLIIA